MPNVADLAPGLSYMAEAFSRAFVQRVFQRLAGLGEDLAKGAGDAANASASMSALGFWQQPMGSVSGAGPGSKHGDGGADGSHWMSTVGGPRPMMMDNRRPSNSPQSMQAWGKAKKDVISR